MENAEDNLYHTTFKNASKGVCAPTLRRVAYAVYATQKSLKTCSEGVCILKLTITQSIVFKRAIRLISYKQIKYECSIREFGHGFFELGSKHYHEP